jgi:hypothetical protein
MNIFLILLLCWLVGAIVFYLACKDRLPSDAPIQSTVSSLCWPAILVFIVVFRFYDPQGSKGGD